MGSNVHLTGRTLHVQLATNSFPTEQTPHTLTPNTLHPKYDVSCVAAFPAICIGGAARIMARGSLRPLHNANSLLSLPIASRITKLKCNTQWVSKINPTFSFFYFDNSIYILNFNHIPGVNGLWQDMLKQIDTGKIPQPPNFTTPVASTKVACQNCARSIFEGSGM